MFVSLNISKIQRFSVDDGPGIRTTVFLKGCNLRCQWCHNPENLVSRPVLQFKETSCVYCHFCEKVCPTQAHVFSNEGHIIKRERCIGCGACANVCLNHSLELLGSEMLLEEIIEELLKDCDYYKTSGGGVTFSGGEPLLQAKALSKVLKECKNAGLHVAVDTAGNVPFENFEMILPYTDLFLYDIKCISPEIHKKYTGSTNELIIENAKKLRENNVNMWVRTPVIPGFNTNESEMKAIRKFVTEVLQVKRHEELPYHNYGEGKYKMLGMTN